MKLEDQVCSLELAKRLKELGVQQNNVFYWVQGHDMDWNAQASTMPWKVSQITNGKDSFPPSPWPSWGRCCRLIPIVENPKMVMPVG